MVQALQRSFGDEFCPKERLGHGRKTEHLQANDHIYAGATLDGNHKRS